MKGDFTRDTFDARKHYTRVLMQQGRVQIDADWNEQISSLLHYMRTLAADLIGPYGGPLDDLGFGISANPNLSNDFFIGAGHYYVDGILCEITPEQLEPEPGAERPTIKLPTLVMDGRELAVRDWLEILDEEGHWYQVQVESINTQDRILTLKYFATENVIQKIRRLTTYKQQQDYPGEDINVNTQYLAYLDVWERHITQLEDGHIREVALNGVDTTSRAKVMQQVRIVPWGDDHDLNELLELSGARMRARLRPEAPSSDPCIVAPNSKYRGAENQLYRVEIHQVETNSEGQTWSFKWSRDNGSVVAIQLSRRDDGSFIVNSTRGFSAGQSVEVIGEKGDVRGQPGKLHKVVKVDADTLALTPDPGTDPDGMWKFRRWDQRKIGDTVLDEDGAVQGKTGTWLDLENGIQVYFEEGGNYRSGDYWLIPARVTTGQIEWPLELDSSGNIRKDREGNNVSRALAPHGIQHNYAPLAILGWIGNDLQIDDQRCSFRLTLQCSPPIPVG